MTKYVASIHFEPRSIERSIYNGSFHAPAVPRGAKPFLLEVRDHIQLERLPYIVGGGQFPRQIFGEHIAADLITHWTSGALGMTGDCHPGFWIVRDSLPVLDETGTPVKDAFGVVQTRPVTAEEKAAMWDEDLARETAAQKKWGALLVQKGDVLASDENAQMRILISDSMRAAALYYEWDREWLEELKDNNAKSCPFCFKSIDVRVVVCPHCTNTVDQAAYARLTAKPPMPPPVQAPQGKHAA